MNEPRWYCVAATGTAFPCVDKADAESWVNHSNRTMPHCAPYRAVQLVDAEAVRALIRDDALAISFQTMGQYRTMLLKAIGVTDQNGGAE